MNKLRRMYCNKTLKQLKNEREREKERKKMVSNKIAIVLNMVCLN